MNFAGILNNSASVYGGGIYSTNGVLNVYNAFVGVTSGGYTNSAYQGGGICALDSTLYFTNSVISHGLSTFAGGILLYNCYSTMENVHVINNWSSGYGGGILLVGSNGFTASQSSFNNNQADIGGGVCLFAEDGNINFESCNITNNFAESAGGILVYLSSPVNISGYSSISYNNALYSGGGILSFGGYVNLSGDDLAPLTIMKNTVLLNGIGGGICAVSSYVEGEGNIYVGYNEASYGGGIYVTNASIVLTNVFSIAPKVFGNIAGKDGGGIYITGTNSVAKLYNTQIGVENFGNESHAKYGTGNGGGGLAAADSARVDLLNCGFADNFSSNSGGGAYFEKNVTVNMDSYDRTSYQSYFHNNIARNAGGGLYVNEAKSLVVENTYVISNKTLSGGAGGVYISKTSSKLVNLVVAQNNSGYSLGAGGIFFFNCPKSEMLQCTVADNGRIGVYNNLGAALYMTNCIVYGHSLSQLWNRAEINVAYSDIKNGWPGMGNIDSNPMFDAPSALNYRIVIGSPCENTGIDLPSITNDISGTIRPQGAGWDMGAYEVVPEGGMVIWIVGLLQLWFVGRKKFDFKN
ncbi:MAG: hypothetical protein DRI44_09955 [Chlamydiae bacterium]|nr:MAG: hypothetical protein DRI44_09955 [Chlamydiota bacterium]